MSKFAIKEVADVTFFDIETGKPVIFFDTLKVSTIENESETAEARGGRGNGVLTTWNYGRTATLTMQDALLSMDSLSLLAGNEVVTTGFTLSGREKVTVPVGGKITLQNVPKTGEVISIYKTVGGVLTEEVVVNGTTVTRVGADITGLTAGNIVSVFYEYDAPVGAQMVKFTSDAFPGTYRVVGDTIVRDQATGKDKVAQFLIPKASLQSGFSLSLDVENPAVFDFNLNIMKEADSQDLYQIIKLA